MESANPLFESNTRDRAGFRKEVASLMRNVFSNRSKLAKVFVVIFIVLFIGGIALGLFGGIISERHDDGKQIISEEIWTVEPISEVWHNEEAKMLYACYENGSYVNAYTDSGKFLWAVSIPYQSNGCPTFCLDGERLLISHYDTYIYDAVSGKFLEMIPDTEVQDVVDPVGVVDVNSLYEYDLFNLYHVDEDGDRTVLISKPFWILLLYFPIDALISFVGAIGIWILVLTSAIAERKRVPGKVKTVTAKRLIIVFRISILICLLFTIADIVSASYGIPIMSGIIPLMIGFTIQNIVTFKKNDCGFDSEGDRIIVSMWFKLQVASFVAAFLSVVVALAII